MIEFNDTDKTVILTDNMDISLVEIVDDEIYICGDFDAIILRFNSTKKLKKDFELFEKLNFFKINDTYYVNIENVISVSLDINYLFINFKHKIDCSIDLNQNELKSTYKSILNHIKRKNKLNILSK